MARKKISWSIYLTPEQDQRLKTLRRVTGVPASVVVREGVEIALRLREKEHQNRRTHDE